MGCDRRLRIQWRYLPTTEKGLQGEEADETAF
jgi:hypothetical protein